MEKQEDYRLYLYQLPENDHFDRVHAVLVTHDGRILLRYKNGEARITGGHIDPEDANMIAALKRELLEEINCEIDKCDYLGYLEATCEETGKREIWGRMVARVSQILPPKSDPDRAEKWVYGRTLAPAEIAKMELVKSMPMGDTEKLVDAALKVARKNLYFTEEPNLEYEVLNVELHDE